VILKAAIIEDPFRPQVAGGSEIIAWHRGRRISEPARAMSRRQPRAGPRCLWFRTRAIRSWRNGSLAWGGRWRSPPTRGPSGPRTGWDGASTGSSGRSWRNGRCARSTPAEFNAEVAYRKRQLGTLHVEAIDPQGDFRNFLHLQAVVGRSEGPATDRAAGAEGARPLRGGRFTAKEVGAYMVNLLDLTRWPGASASRPSAPISTTRPSSMHRRAEPRRCSARLAEVGGGRVLDPTVPGENPFLHDRVRTHQPRDLWWWLCMIAVVLFPIDVGLRRVQLDREEWARAWGWVTSRLGFGRRRAGVPSREGMASLLARKEQVRSAQGASLGRAASPAEAGAPLVEPAAALFQPRETPGLPPDPSAPAPPQDPSVGPAGPPSPAAPPAAGTPGAAEGATSRLLEAKRRAQKKL
jgi:hypothetical protein